MFPSYRLVAHTGPVAGKAFPLEKSELFIGRDLGNDIVINDPEMSRRHARLYLQGTNYVIEDLGSTNGTYVNGQRLMGPYIMRPGEVITFGERISLVLESAEADPGATMVAGHSPTARPVQQPVQPVNAYVQPAPPPPPQQRYVPPAQAYSQPPQSSVAIENEVSMPPERRRMAPWMLVLIIILAVLCLCLILAFAIDVTDSWCFLFGWLFNMFSPGLCP